MRVFSVRRVRMKEIGKKWNELTLKLEYVSKRIRQAAAHVYAWNSRGGFWYWKIIWAVEQSLKPFVACQGLKPYQRPKIRDKVLGMSQIGPKPEFCCEKVSNFLSHLG